MKKCLFVLTMLALLFQPAVSFLPRAVAQEGGGGSLAPNYPVHYVKPVPTGTATCDSWANACELKLALGAAVPGDEIWVQQGVYKPDFWENLTDFTFVAWVNRTSLGSPWQRIFDFGRDTDNYMFLTPSDSSGRLRFAIRSNGGTEQILNNAASLPINTWQHVAVTLSGNTATIYVNGVLIDQSTTFTYEPKDVIGDNVWLGRSQYAIDPYFNGVVDEVALFNRALSEAEIDGIIASGWNATPGKVLALHLDEYPVYRGLHLLDSQENGHGGVMISDDSSYKSVAGRVGRAIALDGGIDSITLKTRRHGTFNLKSGVALHGGFAGTEVSREDCDLVNHATVLTGDIGVAGDNSDNSYIVVSSDELVPGPTLDCVTIEKGHANGDYRFDKGGGMYIHASNPTITNVIFSSNTANAGGGLYTIISEPTLTNVTFSGNTANEGGGLFEDYNNRTALTDVTFSGNLAVTNGGGMLIRSSESLITNTVFISNTAGTGGGLYTIGGDGDSIPTLRDVTFSGNTADTNGGGMYNGTGSFSTLVNVTFRGNTATTGSGGGLFNTGVPFLTYSSFRDNAAGTSGGGMYTDLTVLPHGAINDPALANVVFSVNNATAGGGMYSGNCTTDARLSLVNVLFNANLAEGTSGGGLYNSNCPASLTNITFAHNSAFDVGGGIFSSGSTTQAQLTLRNSLLWGNTGSSSLITDDQIHVDGADITQSYTTIQDDESAPSPFIDADGADGMHGTADDNLRPTIASAGVIDGGDERDLPLDVFDLDGDLNTDEVLPVDLDGSPRVYADYDMDGQPDSGDAGYPFRVDRGAYEAGCYGWHMQYGADELVEGQAYRTGFHVLPAATIAAARTAFDDMVSESDLGPLQDAREHYSMAIACAVYLPVSDQAGGRQAALTGLLDVNWEAATGSVLFGNEYVVNALDVRSTNPPNALDEEISQLRTSLLWYGWATRVYTETLYPYYDEVMGLQPERVDPLMGDPKPYLDVERLALAAAHSSRASLELAERQFRKFTPQSKADAELTLRKAHSRAAAELTLLESLWEDVVDEPSYAEIVQNMGDMRRLLGYIQDGRNPYAYGPDYVPFYYDPEKAGNNYEQTYDIAHNYLVNETTPQVEHAQSVAREIDDNYDTLQTRLNDAEDRYNSRLVALCGSKAGQPLAPELEDCGGTTGEFKQQFTAIQGASLRVDLAVEKMDNQLRLIAIEQQRAARVAGIHNATARLITATGEQLADLASEEVKLEKEKGAAEGIMGIIGGAFSGAVGAKELGPWGMVAGGLIGVITSAISWKEQNEMAASLKDIAEQRENLKARQAARVEYAEAEIEDANSEALIKQYYLRHAEARIEYTIALNNLMQELDKIAGLKTELEYLLAERDKTLDLIGDQAQYRDPATRVERDYFMEIAYNMFEQASENAFLAGQALEYQMNEEPAFTPPPLASLDDLYRIRDTFSMDAALAQMETRWNTWAGTHPIPQNREHTVMLSKALGFEDAYDADLGRIVTAEEKFNAFVRDPANRDANGNLQFIFQTSIFRGNRFFPTNYFNDRIVSLRMRLYGQGLGVDDKVIIRLVQGGTSFIRTGQATISGLDDIREYNLEPKLANVAAAVNASPAPPDGTNTEFANRSVAFTDWTLTIDQISEPDNVDLNIDGIEEIEMVVTHRGYSLQTQQTVHPDYSEPPASRAYQPIAAEYRGDYDWVALSAENAVSGLSTLAATSVISDFIGTVAITTPTYMPAFDLNMVLTDTGGVLSGYIDSAHILGFPLDASGRGPAVTGTWQGQHLVLQTAPFTSSDPNLTRQVFLDGVAVGGQLSAAYRELIWDLTPDDQPLEIVGEFILIRAPEPMLYLPIIRR